VHAGGSASQASAAPQEAREAAEQQPSQTSGQIQPAAKPNARPQPLKSLSEASSGSISRLASDPRQPNGHAPEPTAGKHLLKTPASLLGP